MKILVFGGTRFLGRHIVERLASRGDDVTCFHRGRSRCELPPGVREIFGDRNDPLPEALNERWDGVVDVSGQEPAHVQRSCELNAAWYVFISTLNVYADLARDGVEETAATIEAFDPTDEAMAYGGKKAASERIVRDRFGERATVLRPGIIVGRWDYTGRFSYWPRRALRGGRFIVPGPPSRALQLIDARDLAAFAARALSERIGGEYNAVGPRDRFSIGELAETCAAAALERGLGAEPVFVDGEALIACGVEPWTDLPMWIASSPFDGIFSVSNEKAVAAGLEHRAPIESVRSLMDWLVTPEGEAAATPGLSAEREAELLQSLA